MVESFEDFLKEAARENQFKYGVTLPISWKYQALLLKRTSDIIFINYFNAHKEYMKKFESDSESLADVFDEGQIHVYLLLMGYAIENLIRGLVFSQHTEYLVSGERIDGEIMKLLSGKHELIPLFDHAHWIYESKDKHWLKCLGIYVWWRGRYPVPLKVQNMLPKKEKNGTWTESFLSSDPRRDYEELNDLFERIMKKLSDESNTLPIQLPAIEFLDRSASWPSPPPSGRRSGLPS